MNGPEIIKLKSRAVVNFDLISSTGFPSILPHSLSLSSKRWRAGMAELPPGLSSGFPQGRCTHEVVLSPAHQPPVQGDGRWVRAFLLQGVQCTEHLVLTTWSWSLVGWHHIPGDLIQQPVPYNFSVHKPAHPQTHPAPGGLALPCALCCSL